MGCIFSLLELSQSLAARTVEPGPCTAASSDDSRSYDKVYL